MKIKADKKAQVISIIMFFVIVLSVFIVAVLIMSLTNTILNPFQVQINNISTTAGTTVSSIQTSFNKWWDYAVVILFALNIILLMVSSFLVDIHPAFLIVYIISVFLLMVFGGNVLSAIHDITDPTGVFGTGAVASGGDALSNMPLVSWLLNNFTIVMLGIIVLSGVVMYAKFKIGNGQGAY